MTLNVIRIKWLKYSWKHLISYQSQNIKLKLFFFNNPPLIFFLSLTKPSRLLTHIRPQNYPGKPKIYPPFINLTIYLSYFKTEHRKVYRFNMRMSAKFVWKLSINENRFHFFILLYFILFFTLFLVKDKLYNNWNPNG